MNSRDFETLSAIRLKDAESLRAAKRWSACYYFTGYIVESYLKALIARQTKRGDFPDKQRAIESWTHNLKRLVKLAGCESELASRLSNSPEFSSNWAVVVEWSEESRYTRCSKQEACELLDAVTNATNGVLPWLKSL